VENKTEERVSVNCSFKWPCVGKKNRFSLP